MELTELHYRTAWLYYMQNMSQQDIADDLRITRIKVVRLLKEAREAGVVEIRIDHEKTSCFELGHRLREITGLTNVMVVPTGQDPIESVAAGGAVRFEQALGEATTIAIGVGRALTSLARRVPRVKRPKTTTVVSMGGFMTADARYDPMTIAHILTSKLDVEFYQITAPAFSDSPELAAALKKSPVIANTIEMAENADIAFVSVTGLATSKYFDFGIVDPKERQRFADLGLVGEMGGHFFTIDGDFAAEINSANIMVPMPMKCPVVGVNGGLDRVPALIGAIRAKFITELITDEDTAQALEEEFAKVAQKSS